MTLLADLLGEVASYVGANGLPIATIATVLLILGWGRRGMKYGGLVTGWARTAFVVALTLVVLLLTGVITGLDFGPVLGAIKWLLELGAGLIGEQTAGVILAP